MVRISSAASFPSLKHDVPSRPPCYATGSGILVMVSKYVRNEAQTFSTSSKVNSFKTFAISVNWYAWWWLTVKEDGRSRA